MSQNNSVNVVDLDFDGIKDSLKSYLQSQSNLKDYNFDGSVLNTILDVLAYNTHYQAFYANMVANEMFLDSALLRQSVVSHAKSLDYLPSSITASKGVVDISLSTPASSDTYLPRGTEFSGTTRNGTRYKFVNLDSVFAGAGDTSFSNVTLYEGTIRAISYIYNRDTKIGSYLIIPNDKADISTLKVRVYASPTDRTGINDAWTLGSDYLNLTPESKVYFLQEKTEGIYELYFGDGILGQQPLTGNVVTIEYLETNGEDANGVVSFTKTNDPSITSVQFIEDPITGSRDSQTFGGAAPESVSKIKYLAPKLYQTANRAVTEDDYTSLVYKLYPSASSVHVYGGETVTPPQYGKVFIAIKPKSANVLSEGEKSTLQTKLRKDHSIITITPEIIDPNFIDLVFDMTVVYNPKILSLTSGLLKRLVYAYVFTYASALLNRFGSDFYYSKLAEGINNVEKSILGVYTKIKMRKAVDVSVILGSKSYTFDFGNAFYHPYDGYTSVLSSSLFTHSDLNGNVYVSCYLKDDGNGIVNVVRTNTETEEIETIYPSVGTVDYGNGKVTVNSKFVPSASATAFPIVVTVEPASTNIFAKANTIIRVSSSYLDSVKVEVLNQDEADVNSLIR
ncbi:MAG: hypothetical protein EB127_06120 [Alphaproteobacteria bacterium]|nr:hypothetical protein [Alphaproteobacteria bacterium]